MDYEIIKVAIECNQNISIILALYLIMKHFASTDYQSCLYEKFSVRNLPKKLDKLQRYKND